MAYSTFAKKQKQRKVLNFRIHDSKFQSAHVDRFLLLEFFKAGQRAAMICFKQKCFILTILVLQDI